MNAIGMEALTAWIVPKIRRELKQKPDGGLPGERERVAAFDTANVLLLGYVNELKTTLARAEGEAVRRAQILNDSELGHKARKTLEDHRGPKE